MPRRTIRPFSDSMLRAQRPGAKLIELRDGRQSGLIFTIHPSGRKQFSVRYRAHGKQRRLVLGDFPALTLSKARERAAAELVTIRAGHDRAVEVRALKERPTLAWYTCDGARVPVQASAGFGNPALSPNGEMLIGTLGPDLYLYEFRRDAERLLVSGTNDPVSTAGWMDDDAVWFRPRGQAVVRKVVSSGEERVLESVNMYMTDLTPSGTYLGFGIVDGNRDILFLKPGATTREAFASTPINETQPALPPDGEWLAYVSYGLGGISSSTSGINDIYIQRFPEGGDRRLVSGDAPGIQPRWRADGKELFYVGNDGRMMAVPITPSAGGITIGEPVALFQTSIVPQPGLGTRASYDVTRDGTRFIVSEAPEGGDDDARSQSSMTVLVNWTSVVR